MIEKFSAPLSMSVTRDPYLIAEYRQLRRRLYKSDPRFVGFRIFGDGDAEDYEDPDDHMLLLHDGLHCHGGMCLRMSTPSRPIVLEVEQDILPPPGQFYFSLRERFPELELDTYGYAESCRFFLHPDVRSNKVVKDMLLRGVQHFVDYRIRYFFALSDRLRTRLYKQIFTAAGVPCTIRNDFDIPMRPEFEGMKMHLLVGDMKALHVTPADPEAKALLSPRDAFEFQ